MSDHLYLAHHGIKGMKWGVRRFQNEDGSLTSAGQKRYGVGGSPMRGASTGGLTNPRSQSMERYVKRHGINGRPDPKAPTYKPTPYKLTRRPVSKSADQKQDGTYYKTSDSVKMTKRRKRLTEGLDATKAIATTLKEVADNHAAKAKATHNVLAKVGHMTVSAIYRSNQFDWDNSVRKYERALERDAHKQRKKQAKDRLWSEQDRLEEEHDRVATDIMNRQRSGEISRREANRQFDEAWKQYTDADDAARKQYKREVRRRGN